MENAKEPLSRPNGVNAATTKGIQGENMAAYSQKTTTKVTALLWMSRGTFRHKNMGLIFTTSVRISITLPAYAVPNAILPRHFEENALRAARTAMPTLHPQIIRVIIVASLASPVMLHGATMDMSARYIVMMLPIMLPGKI